MLERCLRHTATAVSFTVPRAVRASPKLNRTTSITLWDNTITVRFRAQVKHLRDTGHQGQRRRGTVSSSVWIGDGLFCMNASRHQRVVKHGSRGRATAMNTTRYGVVTSPRCDVKVARYRGIRWLLCASISASTSKCADLFDHVWRGALHPSTHLGLAGSL
jgi:hypothetical protein